MPVRWCLEEDGDSGYGTKDPLNKVEKFKIDLGILRAQEALHTTYYNHLQSPDLSPIEDIWSYPKIYLKKRPHWDNQTVAELVHEAWA